MALVRFLRGAIVRSGSIGWSFHAFTGRHRSIRHRCVLTTIDSRGMDAGPISARVGIANETNRSADIVSLHHHLSARLTSGNLILCASALGHELTSHDLRLVSALLKIINGYIDAASGDVSEAEGLRLHRRGVSASLPPGEGRAVPADRPSRRSPMRRTARYGIRACWKPMNFAPAKPRTIP